MELTRKEFEEKYIKPAFEQWLKDRDERNNHFVWPNPNLPQIVEIVLDIPLDSQ